MRHFILLVTTFCVIAQLHAYAAPPDYPLPPSAATCSDTDVAAIQDCVTPVLREAERLGLGMQAQFLPNKGKEVYAQLCQLLDGFEQCLVDKDNVPSRCPNHITMRLMKNSYGYLCNEGRKTFLANADCLMTLDHENSVRVCHKVAMGEIKAANNRGPEADTEVKAMEMCDALHDFTTCIQLPVLEKCGEAAWGVIVRVLRDTTRTLMPNCEMNDVVVPSPEPEQEKPIFEEISNSGTYVKAQTSPNNVAHGKRQSIILFICAILVSVLLC